VKKISASVLFIGLFIFSSCALWGGSGGDVISLTYKWQEGAVPPSYFSEETLNISPDYEERLLKLEYEKVFPYRDEETLEEDFEGDGAVGGQFFDRFEEIITYFENGDIDNFFKEIQSNGGCEGGSGFSLIFAMEKSSEEFSTHGYCLPSVGGKDANEVFDFLDDFYRDAINLLTESVPV